MFIEITNIDVSDYFVYCNEHHDTEDDEINKTVDKNISISSTTNTHQGHSRCIGKHVQMRFQCNLLG